MNIDKLCQDHWAYVEQVIRNEWAEDDRVELSVDEYVSRVGVHYRTALAHGYKHGEADNAIDVGCRYLPPGGFAR